MRSRNNTTNNSGPLQLLSITSANSNILTYRAFGKTQAKLCVVDNSGQVVKVMNTIIERGVNYLALPMPSLPAGVYSIYASTPKGPSNVLRFVSIK
jgi:hypothetical protein